MFKGLFGKPSHVNGTTWPQITLHSEAQLRALSQALGTNLIQHETPVDYNKQIKELERKFLETQKLLIEEIEKLNERILELETKEPTT